MSDEVDARIARLEEQLETAKAAHNQMMRAMFDAKKETKNAQEIARKATEKLNAIKRSSDAIHYALYDLSDTGALNEFGEEL
jgi:hypothetical protein